MLNFKNYPQRLALLGLLLGLGLGKLEAGWATPFSVSPVRVYFAGRTNTGLLTVKNPNPNPVRLQLSTFSWDQSSEGKTLLAPTEDIIAFPLLLNLQPGEERKLRVGTKVPPGEREKAYRVFVEELPTIEPPAQQSAATQINFLLRLGIPIFVAPAKSELKGEIENLAVRAGRVSFQLKNTGNVHFATNNFNIKGYSPDGKVVFEGHPKIGYILGGRTKLFDLELPAKDCSKANAIAVEVTAQSSNSGQQSKLRKAIALPKNACVSPRIPVS